MGDVPKAFARRLDLGWCTPNTVYRRAVDRAPETDGIVLTRLTPVDSIKRKTRYSQYSFNFSIIFLK